MKVLPGPQPFNITSLPDEDTINLANEQTVTEFGDLINLSPETDELKPEEIAEAFEHALVRFQADGWRVEIDPKLGKQSITVRQGSKRVLVPAEHNVKKNVVDGLIIHEIGTHVLRRLNGERTKLKLLGLGLDRVGPGEEGIGVTREQAIKKEVRDFRGLAGHFAISLAVGLDGQPRNFRAVYEILNKLYKFNNVFEGQDQTIAEQEAREEAWRRCVRTFRGSDCKTPGICSHRDIYYREGNIAVWNLIRNNPEEMFRFSIGKYNPANSRHLWVLKELGITDQDLNLLEH